MKRKSNAIHWDVVGLFALLLLCDTAAQLFFKQGVNKLGEFPTDNVYAALHYAASLGSNQMVLFGIGALLIAFFTWLAIIARVDLSKAHPITCLSFGTVTLCSTWLLHEPFSLRQAVGVALIMLGAYIASEHTSS